MCQWGPKFYYSNSSAQKNWGFELLAKLRFTGSERFLYVGCGDRKSNCLNLQMACLKVADLANTHLEGANLINANLEKVDLMNAHLEGANLFGANLEGAFLINANLEGTFLMNAHLEGADLHKANLKKV
jgi:uncharacterized protein YjbI with pentapeptide repeats